MMELDPSSNTGSVSGIVSGGLEITEIGLAGEVVLGISACPGRCQIDNTGTQQAGNLDADLVLLDAWGARILISLVEIHEFSKLGVPDFEAVVRVRDLRWYHLPIADMGIPGDAFLKSWNRYGGDILKTIEQGGRIAIHCAEGLGRSGMIAAKLMTVFDILPIDAIDRVRKARPGAIETKAQEDYVLNGPALIIAPT